MQNILKITKCGMLFSISLELKVNGKLEGRKPIKSCASRSDVAELRAAAEKLGFVICCE
jgi:hypothetical protein